MAVAGVINSRQFDVVHARTLEQMLARGQPRSRMALINLSSGAVLVRGKESPVQQSVDASLLNAFGRSLFAFNRASEATRAQLGDWCESAGGITALAVLLRSGGLFLGRLPNSSLVLSLVIDHGGDAALASETAMRGRSIRHKLATDSVASGGVLVKQSYSIWKALLSSISSYFAAAGAAKGPVSAGILDAAVAGDDHVVSAELFDLSNGKHLDSYRHARRGGSRAQDFHSTAQRLSSLFSGELDIDSTLKEFGFENRDFGKVQIQVGKLDFYWLRVPFAPTLYIPFGNDTAMVMYKEPRPNPALDWLDMDLAGLNLLRMRIGAMLVGGMKTEMFPFPQTQNEFHSILERLGSLPKDDLEARLDIGGFAAHPVTIEDVSQRCQECIYYLPHRKWCDLPELPVPVEPNWWCRLWKI
jgi:hypothetical protein